ncbi:MAG: hypothetical protein KY468_04870 [Armatimonadetes bacterium]|nr:hypothetical protein [Armatimonadota bacterium]
MNRRTALSLLCAAWGMASLQAHAAAPSEAVTRRAWYTVNPTTMTMKMALPPGLPKNLPFNLPGLDGAPKKSLNMGLWSPQTAPAGAKAEADVPEGLKVGKTIPLPVDNFTLPKVEDQQFRMSYYYGCATAVPAGQPVTYTLDSWTKQMGDFKGSTAAPRDPKISALPKEASAKGTYALRSYAGNVTTDLPAELDFLDPVNLVAPQPGDPLDPSKTILVAWEKVPRAKGYLVTAVGMKGESGDQAVMWWSAGDPKFGMVQRSGQWNDVSLADRIKRGWLLGPDVLRCNIPAGIFKAGSPITVSVTAMGDEKIVTQRYDAATKTNVPLIPAVSISPQSITTVMVGMPGVGGVVVEDSGDGEDEDREENEDN